MTNPEPPTDGPDEVHISAIADPAAAAEQREGAVVATFQCRPTSGEWLAHGDITRGAQGLVISRVELQALNLTGNGITGSLLRRIQVGDVLHLARSVVARAAQSAEAPAPVESPEKRSRSGGRSALSEDLLRSVAVAYLAETAPGRPAGAVKRMAVQFDRPEETVRGWVARARKAGWLGPSVKGRAGAEPGPLLRDLTPEEFGRIFPEGYDAPPQDLAELAAGFDSMSQERQRAASVAWFTPERQAEHNRQTLEWERQEQERRAAPPTENSAASNQAGEEEG
ncbi:hypothetical protein HEP87_19835 [Streptomyces sp. S1D4-11]|nr:hypothetical protein [Streptomyces sp. S1D4-11]QIY95872.1 hypothetical protein HEP87_19835 [Streptomyces sp. S1D4-11]